MKKDECPPPPAEHDAALTLLVQVCCHVFWAPLKSSKQVARRPPPGLDFPTALKRDLFGVLCLSGGGSHLCVFIFLFRQLELLCCPVSL